MNENRFYSNVKLSNYKVILLIVNGFLIYVYGSNGVFDWIMYLILLMVFFQIMHIIDFLLKRSYISLDGDILTIHKFLGGTKKYDLSEYDEFKGRMRGNNITSLVSYKTGNPKLFVFIMNIYKKSLNEFFNVINPVQAETVMDAEIIEETETIE